MEEAQTTHKHLPGYGMYVLIWMILIGLTITTVAVAGLNFGKFTLVIALAIAALKSGFVANIFMHIKFDHPIFKIFIALALLTLLSVFVLTAFDVFFR
ncbi:MAG: cytochrome C oxidase subunit IV family protein [FCB group bacterium]|jgi:cytochrome c oxidase subunit 4